MVFVEGESEINQTSRECSCQSNCFFFFFFGAYIGGCCYVCIKLIQDGNYRFLRLNLGGGGIKVIRETNVHGEILDEDGILYRILT